MADKRPGQVRSEVVGTVAWLTIWNPDRANACDMGMLRSLAEQVRLANLDDRVGAIALTGDGPSHFCSGADLAEFAPIERAADLEKESLQHLHAIADSPKAVVAVVNGAAVGGGVELTLACDLVVATDSSSFSLPEVSIGVVPPFALERLARRTGELAAFELIATGRVLDAHSARAVGLVTQLVRADELRTLAQSIGEALGAVPRGPIERLKRHLRTSRTVTLDAFVAAAGNLTTHLGYEFSEPSHVAVVVDDLARAMTSLGEVLGLDWASVFSYPVTAGSGNPSRTLRATWSVQGPPHLELIERVPETIWAVRQMHHVGVWSDDLERDSQALIEAGFTVDYTLPTGTGAPMLRYLRSATTGLRIELTDGRLRAPFARWLGGGRFAL